MEPKSAVRALWRRFRGLTGWVQLVASIAALVVVSPFTSEGDRQTVAATAPTTATVAPATTTTPAPATTTTSTLPPGVPAQGEDTSVVRVIDGDTVEVAGGTRVRLIGVDTPETADCFGSEATRYAKELMPAGTRVRLVYDVQRLDAFGRTLAYVYKLTDGVFVNLAVTRNGFAQQLTVPPNVAHAEEFRLAAASARGANLGLWDGCLAPATTTTAAAPTTTRATVARPVTTTTAAPPAGGGGCHPSYAGACVPTGFSDVDCAGGTGDGPGYVSAKRFQVVGPDVYGLDGNNDGIACQS
ncbi:MAG TPA: thermonuclease family protein [Acidimicrobiales bacterium]|nr:thermonuclease family protein [Acidimicrobiales bacterium]